MKPIYKITSKFSFIVLISVIIGFEYFGHYVTDIFYKLPISPETALSFSSTLSSAFTATEMVFIFLLLVKTWKEGYRSK